MSYRQYFFVNDFLSDKLPASFENVFRLNSDVQSAYKTRQSNLVHSGRCDSVFSSKLPLYNFPCVWNKYDHIFQSDTYSHNPKTRMKNYFLSTYLESVKCTNRYCKQCFYIFVLFFLRYDVNKMVRFIPGLSIHPYSP